MSVCDPHQKAYVNRIGTVGDTQQIANDSQRYYVCVGSPEPFVISRYRTRELGVNRAQCKIQSQSYFLQETCGIPNEKHTSLLRQPSVIPTNGLQHLYVCEGAPEPFVIEHYRRWQLLENVCDGV